MIFRHIKNQKGLLLLEAVISLGIAGILMVSFISMMDIINLNVNKVNYGVSKNELVSRIKMNAISIANIESSAKMTKTLGANGLTPNIGTANNLTKSASLVDCLPSLASSTSCSKEEMENTRGNRFYLSENGSEDPNKAIAGEDVFFTLNGVRCTQQEAVNATNCPISAMVWYEPFCMGFGNTCNKAASLTIRYRISLRTDYTGNATTPPLEGEVYLPLQKGIQMSRLLDQNDNPIPLNASGIYSVQKFLGMADQTNLPKALRFEVILGNPTGLSSMKLQMRKLVGTSATNLPDNDVPDAISNLTWSDVTLDPCNANSGIWSVTLGGAKPNQIINMGTQATPNTFLTTPRSFPIGAGPTDASQLQTCFRWSVNSTTGNPVAPPMKSGFYQFRILAYDINGGTLESMNYITVRIVPRPQFLTPLSQPSFNQFSNCTDQRNINFNFLIADDEGLGSQTVTLNGDNMSFVSINGTSGNIAISFDLSQDIGNLMSKPFNLKADVSNYFTGQNINSFLIPASTLTLPIVLSQKAVSFQSILSNPSKIRISTNAEASVNYYTGSCCSENPTVSWSYPNVSEVGSVPMLSEVTPSSVSCSLDAASNTRTCTSRVTISGIKEGPSVATNNIRVNYNFPSNSAACTNGVANQLTSAYLQVVRIPGIQFYLSESLWLTLPSSGIANSLTTFTPKMYIRIDFPPDEAVTVRAIKASDGVEICTVTFAAATASATMNPIDQSCNIPAGYSGDIILQKVSANVMSDADTPDPSFRAKLVTGKLNHRVCQASIKALPEFADYSVTSNQPMLSSPWGYTLATDGVTHVEDAKNDANLWTAGSTKVARCYDRWSGSLGTSTFNTTDADNIQDIYGLYRYNTETKPANAQQKHRTFGGSTAAGFYRYQTYIYPDNPNLDFDAKNVPYVFVVYQNATPGSIVWAYINPTTSASSFSPPKPWTDFTPSICTGNATLSTIKLFGAKASGHSTAETVMRANNNMFTTVVNGSGFYSYLFMCSFGRWNPSNKSLTNWTN